MPVPRAVFTIDDGDDYDCDDDDEEEDDEDDDEDDQEEEDDENEEDGDDDDWWWLMMMARMFPDRSCLLVQVRLHWLWDAEAQKPLGQAGSTGLLNYMAGMKLASRFLGIGVICHDCVPAILL